MIRRTLVFVLMCWSLLVVASSASAQLVAAKDGPVVYGHHHLNVTSVEPQKKFFVDALGGTAIKIGTNNLEIVKFPGVLIFFTQRAPTGGTIGTTANHIGFSVPNLRAAVDKVKANGFKMVTATEAGGRDVKDDIAAPAQPGGASIAFALGPDDVKVELYDGKSHSVDSSEMAFRTAASMGVKAALADAGTVVLEPVSTVTVTVPADLQGTVLTDLSGRRGRVSATETAEDGRARVVASVPEAELARYVLDLRSMTGGQAELTITPDKYMKAPSSVKV